MYVKPIQRVIFNRLRAVFPMQVKPAFGYSDFIGEHATNGFPRLAEDGSINSGNIDGGGETAGGMEFDPIISAIYPRALFVLHDNIERIESYYEDEQLYGPNLNPTVLWYDAQTDQAAVRLSEKQSTPGFTQVLLAMGGYNSEGDFISGDKGSYLVTGELSGNVKCQGFTSMFTLYPPSIQDEGITFTALRWRCVGAGGNIRWYAFAYYLAGEVRLGYNDSTDGDGNPHTYGWNYIDNLKIGDRRSELLRPTTHDDPFSGFQTTEGESFIAEVRLLGGQLRIMIGSNDTPYLFPHPNHNSTSGEPDWMIDRFQVAGQEVYGAVFSVHPTKFRSYANTVSNDINVGYIPDEGQIANIHWRTHYIPNHNSDQQKTDDTQIGFHPDNCTAEAYLFDLNGTTLRYQLAFSNQEDGSIRGIKYSHYTSAVRAVSLDIPGREWSFINPPTILGPNSTLPSPEGIDVYHTFDLGSLTITSRAELHFNNFRGVWTNGYGTGFLDTTGHYAASIDLGIAGFDAPGAIGGGLRREFTGIGNTAFENNWNGQGHDTVTVHCEDFMTALDVPVWNLPWMDGWNIYYAMYYLAGLGSITRNQLNFQQYIPSNPYGASPGLTPDKQFYLPVGPAGAPLTRFGGGQKIREIMLKISNSVGFVLFFNALAQLEFFKFQVFPVTPLTKTFTHVAGSGFNVLQPGIDEIWSGNYSSSLKEVRNSVTTIGVNALGPLWDPIVAHEYDIDSIYNDFAPNFKGFHDPLVWVDNIFADLAFAGKAALDMLAYLRIPEKTINFNTWYPGGQSVFPGDMVRVVYPRSGATQYAFFVTSTHSSHRTGAAPTMTIGARLVPGTLLL